MADKNTSLPRDLSVDHDATIGRRLDVRGNANIGHSLRVRGWLDAPNIIGTAKGLFGTIAELKAAYPDPQDGWYAFVGTTLPAEIYIVKDGVWMDTGNKGGEPTTKSDYLEGAVEELQDGLNKETEERKAADETLQANIDKEAEERNAADEALQANVNKETEERKAADESETKARTEADKTLQENIDATNALLYPTIIISSTDYSALDTLGGILTTHAEAVGLAAQTHKSRFVVKGTWGNQKAAYVMGILDLLSDDAGHVLTEVLTTQTTMTDGALDKGSHSDGKLFQYFRCYNIDSPNLSADVDTWTEWQRLDTYTLTTVSEMISKAIPQMIDGVAATVDDLPSTKGLYYYVTSEGCFYRTNGKSSKGTEVSGLEPDATLLYITKSDNKIYRWTETDGMIMLSDFSTIDTRVSALEKSVDAIEKKIGNQEGIATLAEDGELNENELPHELLPSIMLFSGFVKNVTTQNIGVAKYDAVYFDTGTNRFVVRANATYYNEFTSTDITGDRSHYNDIGTGAYSNKIYIDTTTNIPYRWDGTTLVAIAATTEIEEAVAKETAAREAADAKIQAQIDTIGTKEASWQAAEDERVSAEKARVSAENKRVVAETVRSSHEKARQEAETARENAEAERENTYNRLTATIAETSANASNAALKAYQAAEDAQAAKEEAEETAAELRAIAFGVERNRIYVIL